jgi:hypothetical protein
VKNISASLALCVSACALPSFSVYGERHDGEIEHDRTGALYDTTGTTLGVSATWAFSDLANNMASGQRERDLARALEEERRHKEVVNKMPDPVRPRDVVVVEAPDPGPVIDPEPKEPWYSSLLAQLTTATVLLLTAVAFAIRRGGATLRQESEDFARSDS